MGFFSIIGGALASSSLIAARVPSSKDLFDKLAPFMGWIGLILFVNGIYMLIFSSILGIATIGAAPLAWTIGLVTSLATTGVGLILGYNLLDRYVFSKNPTSAAKAAQMKGKLVRYQGPLGIVTMVAGVLYILF